jgi:hypothetical protein
MRPLTSLPAVTVVVIALCSGCAARTGKPSACEPVPGDFALAGQIVYAECGVDKKARLSTTLPRLDYTPSRDRACVRAVIDVVVDSTGQPVQETARVVRSTDPALGLAVLNSLGDLRYDPALKDGRPVPRYPLVRPHPRSGRRDGQRPADAAALASH